MAERGTGKICVGPGFAAGRALSWCCFTCQQAAEKALEVVCEHFRTPQRGSNLNFLVQDVSAHVAVSEHLRIARARLNRYHILTGTQRLQPGPPAEQFLEPDAQESLEEAKEVGRFAEGIVGST